MQNAIHAVNRAAREAIGLLDAELQSVSVRTAPEPQRTGAVDWSRIESAIGGPETSVASRNGLPIKRQWAAVLGNSIHHRPLFRRHARRKLALTVEIQKVDMSGIAKVDFDLHARYRLTDCETGDDVFVRTIQSHGVAGPGEAFVGALRTRLAFARSIQANIAGFISKVESVSFS